MVRVIGYKVTGPFIEMQLETIDKKKFKYQVTLGEFLSEKFEEAMMDPEGIQQALEEEVTKAELKAGWDATP